MDVNGMIRSMTGFGQAETIIQGLKIRVEVKSVNHRYTETHFRIPREWHVFEDKLKKMIQHRVKRGRVDLFVTTERTEVSNPDIEIDWALAEGFQVAALQLKQHFALDGELTIKEFLDFPDIVKFKPGFIAEDLIEKAMLKCTEKALNLLLDMRTKEGANLWMDIKQRLSKLEKLKQQAASISITAVDQYRLRLKQRLHELLNEHASLMDENRLLMEVALMAERTNIDEELTRLQSHFEQFSKRLTDKESIGRKLDFLIQEMNREINTIGSKSSHIELVNVVIEMKAELEKIREQVQNIE